MYILVRDIWLWIRCEEVFSGGSLLLKNKELRLTTLSLRNHNFSIPLCMRLFDLPLRLDGEVLATT